MMIKMRFFLASFYPNDPILATNITDKSLQNGAKLGGIESVAVCDGWKLSIQKLFWVQDVWSLMVDIQCGDFVVCRRVATQKAFAVVSDFTALYLFLVIV
jgi:hypothetical protein